jgi:hypothetical protein
MPYGTRSGFKIPDWVQGQGVRPIGKAQHTGVCEHLPGLCCTLIFKIRYESRTSGATQPLGPRWDFETTSRVIALIGLQTIKIGFLYWQWIGVSNIQILTTRMPGFPTRTWSSRWLSIHSTILTHLQATVHLRSVRATKKRRSTFWLRLQQLSDK